MSTRAGVLNVYRQAADGTGTVERLATSPIPPMADVDYAGRDVPRRL
jgi:hypothetical protein